jgi:hypothetical protein
VTGASVTGVVDHQAPGSKPMAPSTAASMKDGTKSGGPHRRGLRRWGVGTPGVNPSTVKGGPVGSSVSIELPGVLFVASLLQGSSSRVDHERYYRSVAVVANTVPFALGDEHRIALAEAHRPTFGEG